MSEWKIVGEWSLFVPCLAPASRLCRTSPTYERWRVELVAALGATSTIIEATKLYTREVIRITWCKGEQLARILGSGQLRPQRWRLK